MTRLIEIGHSRGVRIPKAIIEQTDLAKYELEFQIVSEGLLIKPIHSQRRHGWMEAFKNAAPVCADDIADFGNQFDDEDWVWEEKMNEKI